MKISKNQAKTSKKSPDSLPDLPLGSRHLPSADVVERMRLNDLTPQQLQLFLAFQSGTEETRGQEQLEGSWVLSWHLVHGQEQILINEVGPAYEMDERDLAFSQTRIGILTLTAHAMSRFFNDLVANGHLAIQGVVPPPIFINGEPIDAFEITAELYPQKLGELVAGWETQGQHAIAEAGREALAGAVVGHETSAKTISDNLVTKQIPFDDPLYETSAIFSIASPSQEKDTPASTMWESKKRTSRNPKPRLQ